jgi:subtilase-type proteinase RRT12
MLLLLYLLIIIVKGEYSWSIDRINQKSIIPDFQIFNKDYGDNVTVYVIDSGFTENVLFFDNIILEKSFIDDNLNDTIGHGTHVISLISSKYGVSHDVKIVSLKVFNSTHGSDEYHLIDALDFTKQHCSNHSRKCIINLSLGFDVILPNIDIMLEDIYNNNDAIIVVSSGNSNIDSCLRTPSHLDFTVTVGSINYFDLRSSFSNYGKCTDLYTYGEFVPGVNKNGGITFMSGTSMSAPIVTGIIANLWSKNPNLKNHQLKKKFYDDYIIKRNNLNILYTNEKELDLAWIFLPIAFSFFLFSFFKCLLC